MYSLQHILAFLATSLIVLQLNCISTNEASNISPTTVNLVPAFPGAMGGGMFTTGGRGGKVIKVTNLNDDGPGSLRKAIRSKGPRTIIFEVSGTIELKSSLDINNDSLTIAGQTAPGDGICLKGHEMRISASNVIIRFIRFRPGDIGNTEYDALTGMRNKNIIIDHCSMSWSTDETVSLYDNEDFTLQRSIISESLNNSVHRKGSHGYGGIWGGKNASFLNNILAHHTSRNPRLQGTRYQKEENMEKAELINNLIYNWGDKAIYGGENGRYNIINNIFIPGPASPESKTVEILEPYESFGEFYLSGNEIWTSNQKTVSSNENITLPEGLYEKHILSTPFDFIIKTSPLEPQSAYDYAIKYSGASLVRDKIDQRIINDISNRSYTYGNMGIIDSQNITEGWPALNSMPPLVDSDGDGMPDEWETKHGLSPCDASDGNAYTINNQYTNLEVYINSLVNHIDLCE